MSNAITRFKTRKSGAVVITVPWSVGELNGEPEHLFNLQVNVFAQSELNNAAEIAKETLAKRLVPEPTEDSSKEERAAYNNSFNSEYWIEAGYFVKRHVVGWEHKPNNGSEPITYTKAVAEAILMKCRI